MKRGILPVIAISLSLLVACKGEESGYIPESGTVTTSSSSVDSAKQFNQVPQSQIPHVSTVPAAAVPVQTATTPSSKGAVNPPHGQPGHRCDIAVGAPLNAPAQPTVTQTASPQVITSSPTQVIQKPVTSSSPATPQTAPGMNPPHGQPGHRCDISVGAPLNSKPASQPTEQKAPVVEPVKADSAAGGK